MRPPFKRVSLDQFAELLARFRFTRSINAVHMHHTWRPNHSQFKGHDSIVSMWRYHTENNGWSDIAQHITIDPNGEIWLGRDWNTPPASAKGANGTYEAGPFMFEMIGDFDVGRDRFEGKQRAAAIAVTAMVQQAFKLPLTSLKFHRSLSQKTCPGSSINYEQTLDEVGRVRREMQERGRGMREFAPPFHPDSLAASADIEEVLMAMKNEEPRTMSAAAADADACAHHHHEREEDRHDAYAARGDRVPSLTAGQPDLRPHLVNLTMGELSSGGLWTTTRADIDAIFDTHLPHALEQARAAGRPLRLMFQAHGGLNDEATGLAIARKSVAWWLENGIYPVYFVWETGLFESIGQLLRSAISGKRDFADYTSDPLIQESVRLLGAPKIWGVMKQNAQVASSPDTLGNSQRVHPERQGGAHYVAQQLAAFCKRHGDQVELHAVGHSAGAIFHSWFIPCALSLGTPGFRSLHLMAPAVRVDLFKEKLAPLLGRQAGIGDLTVYTMKDTLEARDDCAGIYRKSLLYLIFHALEPQRRTPILGLEESLRADSELSRMFGLSGGAGTADVIWSNTRASRGASASMATTHGGFDDDPSTMGSIARRILGRQDFESIVEYPSTKKERGIEWEQPASLSALLENSQPGEEIRIGDKRSTRRALCVGINDYPDLPLAGCLADVESWSQVLKRAGFAVSTLLDREATRANIVTQLGKMIAESQKGDVIVFQYSGHGTQFKDENGDEKDGKDEALVPHDYRTGAYLLDDELGQIYARLPEGVNLTCFMDCCHSGSNQRVFLTEGKERARFLPPTQEMVEAYQRYRQDMLGETTTARAFAPEVEAKPTFEVSFAACGPHESAWESQGQGEFTVRATAVLAKGLGKLSNGGFIEKVLSGFGDTPRQRPQLDSSHRGAAKRPLLQPLVAAAAAAALETRTPEVRAGSDLGQLLEVLQKIEHLLQQAQPQGARGRVRGRPNGEIPVSPPQSLQLGAEQNR